MSQTTATRCDGPACGRVKQESNHWLKLFESGELFLVWKADAAPPANLSESIAEDLCSPGCVQKRLDAWLSKRKESVKEPQTV